MYQRDTECVKLLKTMQRYTFFLKTAIFFKKHIVVEIDFVILRNVNSVYELKTENM